MSSYTIGQVAQRSGFSATALRYYEGIGLVAPAGRSDAGYRLYDDRTLSRLAFIARAKQLSCSLHEITELVDVWDEERCGPVQRRMHELVTTKLGETNTQIGDLRVFAGQLRAAAAQLSDDPVDGPCAEDCACLHEPDEVPIACTLEPDATGDRITEWGRLLSTVTARTDLPSGGLRLELHPDVDVGALAGLVRAEQTCCAFFRFAITVDDRGVGLEVDGPPAAHELLVDLFGGAQRCA